ncbi:NAD(P)-dependent dehydrogenase, short-chain alcohol dehydrogenase family [Duganella sp. CF402]|uniref:SDR family oxidoreductase n=1 Tax=unclassified Duganella TaxID=2636909 RepID=UPI0008B3B0C1|nr:MULTISPECIES: SDR family oxidoreductase [unclassified Duganella]RZT08857.1 NAD(P)-dependent dehydrogenase (short-subunit alcohol dehydrogenase family) [Duganella sp. BK701]SEL79244.1 NAD(P)-dependent dehydrogenase, short-chain alcohol dehydrogenase family [Duganella sp. CF402]
MSERLKGKVAIVTGSTQGIGLAIARRFAAEGAMVTLNSHREDDAARAITTELGSERSLFVHADVADRAAMETLAARTIERFGKVDILINNAGMNVFDDPLALSEEDWKRCFAVDLEGAWNGARAVLPSMLAQGAGSIVNIASVHGHKIIPGCFPYPVAKHALIGMTRALGLEYAARGIRVNSISPGLIVTDMIERHFAAQPDPEAERARQAALLPCKRLGKPEEVAATALFLASDEAPFINATDILIDGGRSQLYHE